MEIRSTGSVPRWLPCFAGWFSSVCASECPECRVVASAVPLVCGPPGCLLGPAWRGCVARRRCGATAPRSPRSAPPPRHQPPPALTAPCWCGRRRWTPVRRSRRAAAQPRRCHDAFPQTSRPAPGRVGLLGEKRARQPQNLIGALQLRVLLAEPFQLLGVLTGQPVIPLTTVGLVLADPFAERLGVPIPSSRATSAIVRPSEDDTNRSRVP